MKYFKLALIALPALFASTVWATQVSCPDAAEIQNVGITIAKMHHDNYTVGTFANYGTPQTWGFAITNVTAVSAPDALAKANAALASVTLTKGPIYTAAEGITICNYSVSSGYNATAITVE